MGAANGAMHGLLLVIILLALGLTALVTARSLRLSPIVGYLVMGSGLAMFDPDLLRQNALVALLAQLGVVFLLFDIGLHFSLARIRAQARDIFGFGSVQVVLGTIALGAAGLLLGLSLPAAAIVGAMLALSSTAVAATVIADRHQQNCPVGRTATSILVFQDVAAIILLVIVSAFGAKGMMLVAAGGALLKAIAAFLIAAALGRVFVRPFFAFVADRAGEEAFTATALLVVLTAGWAAAGCGLSMTLGAFLGGMAVSETPFRAKVRSEIDPFRGLFLGFFFVAVGFSIDVHVVAAFWPRIVLAAALIMAIKTVTNGAASLLFKWSVPGSIQLGFLLAQGSEFTFVVLGLPGMHRLVGEPAMSVLLGAVALSLAATGPFAGLGRMLAARLRATRSPDDRELRPGEPAPPILIVGMGETGRTIADAMLAFDIAYEALEHDSRMLGMAIADGYSVSFGDPLNPAIWPDMFRHGRRYCVLTAPQLEHAADLTTLALVFYPWVRRIAVTDHKASAVQFEAAGLCPISRGSAPRGREVARVILLQMGIDEAAVSAWLAAISMGLSQDAMV